MKPFSPDELRTKIRLAVAKAEAHRELLRKHSLARAAETERRWKDAERLYREMLVLEPASVDAHLGLASVCLVLKPKLSYDEALLHIREAIRMNPRREEPRIALALAYEKGMSLENALRALRDALKECPLSERIHYEIGRLLIRRGKAEEGLQSLRRALELKEDYAEARELLERTERKLKP
jgi:tetratricopeptide (TPR) repeat protein